MKVAILSFEYPSETGYRVIGTYSRNLALGLKELGYQCARNHYSPHPSIKIEGDKAFLYSNDYTDLTNTFPGGASFINRKIFSRLGLYDDKMFVGFEDYELCIRGILLKEQVKCRLIHDIELFHNHRELKSDIDKKAALDRYNYKVHKESIDRIFEIHNIHLCTDWKNWLTNQKEKILNKRKVVSLKRIKKIVFLIKRKMFEGR